jgi:FkbM family methyltransferase
VSVFEGATQAQRIELVLGKLRHRLAESAPVVSPFKAWVYEGRVGVFDYIINGREIAFDVTIDNDASLRVDVFCRGGNKTSLGDIPSLRAMKDGRYLVMESPKSPVLEDHIRQVSQAINKTIAEINQLGAHPSDLRILKCVAPISPLFVVDVGANDLSPPPYLPLRQAGLCKIIGFEPQQAAFEELEQNKSDDELYFPYAIGAPGEVNLNIYSYSGFTSIFKIAENTIRIAPNWFSGTRLKQTVPMKCSALDEIPDLPKFDLLKIDIQGGELNVFLNARRALSTALCVITEVSFFPLYEKAPSFAEIHQELVKQGFLLHKFLHQTHISVASSYPTGGANLGSSQLIDGDAVYLRDFRNIEGLDSEDIKKLALLGHFVFSSKDLVMRMLGELVRRNELSAKLVDDYIKSAV